MLPTAEHASPVDAAPAAPPFGSEHHRRWRTALVALVVAALAVLQLGAPRASAVETDEINAERAKREELRQQQVELARFMDPLLAENDELEARVRTLEDDAALQQGRLSALQQAIVQAENNVLLANAAVGEKTLEIAALKESIQLQAVEAYLQPQDESVSQLLTSADITEAGRRRALIDTIGQREADLLDQLRAAEDELIELVEDAEAAVADVQAQRIEEERQLASIEASIAAAEQARQDLDARVAEVQAEIDGYADSEAEVDRILNQLVAAEEARLAEIERQRLAEERARVEAERARLAALTAPPAVAEETGAPTSAPLVEAPPPAAPAPTSMMMPTSGVITSGFGPRWGRMHQGIDIGANTGTAVNAALGGTIVSAGANGGYGNMVLIDHGDGVVTLYAHLSSIAVNVGATVGQGVSIGQVGCTGSCTGAHLHFEVRVGGVAYDPMNYLG